MIRKISENEKDELMNQLKQDPSRTMFIYGDIQQNGLDTEYQEVWLDDHEGKIGLVLLRYHNNLVFYVFDRVYDYDGFKRLLDDPRISVMSGIKAQIDTLPQSLFESFEFRTMYFCECKALKEENASTNVQKAKAKDVHYISESFDSIVEFSDYNTSLEERSKRMRDKIEMHKSRAYIIYEDGKVVAHANTAVETDVSVMIGSVFTLLEYRNKGLASQVVYALTKACLSEGKLPCLFYDNPKAGSIYHRLGYETFDFWMIGKKVKI